MKVSTRGRYAIRIMLDISMNTDGGPVSFKEVSQRQDISIKYMEQIGSMLTRAGFLRSVRGAHGGYCLVNAPCEYTIGEILRVTEGPLSPVSCIKEGESSCSRIADCMTYPLWEKLDKAINDVVDNITLQDLIDDDARRHLVCIDDGE